MAKRKDLLLTESTTMRMMGLAGIGSLANPFLKEELHGGDYNDYALGDQEEEQMEEGYGYEEEGEDSLEEETELPTQHIRARTPEEAKAEEERKKKIRDKLEKNFKVKVPKDEESVQEEGYEEEGEDALEEAYYDEEEGEDALEEGKRECPKCGEVHEGKGCMQESIQKSMKRLKRLLEQAEAETDLPPPPAAAAAEEPPAMEGGDDQMEAKIKEFVKKLGELVQETLGVEVTVEEGEGAPEELPPPSEGEAAPAPMAEAINRLVNKVARRVKARLMEAKKESEKKKLSKKELEDLEGLEAHYGEEMRAGIKGKHSHKSRMAALQAAKSKELEDLEGLEKHYGEEMRAGIKGKHSHKSRMKDIEAAKSNLKEKQMAAKKKGMMMKKKKAAMAKKK